MSYIVKAWVTGNEQATRLIDDLATVGITREQVHILESAAGPEHRSDAISQVGVFWGIIGVLLGSLLGWLLVSWWSLSVIGAIWGGVVGGICGFRAGGYVTADPHRAEAKADWTTVEIETQDRPQADQVRRICGMHQARARDERRQRDRLLADEIQAGGTHA